MHESFRLTQCYHCLAFDHIKTNCPHIEEPRRCARCGVGEHATIPCGNDARCLHCEGPHPATARCCPVYLQTFAAKYTELLQKIKNQSDHINTELNSTPIDTPENLPDSWVLLSAAVNASVLSTNNSEEFLDSLYTMLKNNSTPPKKLIHPTLDVFDLDP